MEGKEFIWKRKGCYEKVANRWGERLRMQRSLGREKEMETDGRDFICEKQ